jgi:hypothetical protein
MTFARDLLDFGVSIIFENELFRTSMGISNRIMVSSYSPPLEDISSNSMRNLLLYLFILDLETMREISTCNFRVTITSVFLSLAKMLVLPFIKFGGSLVDLLMCISIFGAMEPLHGKLKKLNGGRWLCLCGRKDRLLALRRRKSALLLILFKVPQF